MNKEEANEKLVEAAKKGDLNKVQELLSRGLDANAKDSYGAIALIEASRNGHIEIVKLLLDKGADVNAKDDYDGTALMAAAIWGYTNIVKLLIEKGADVNAKNKDGNTALKMAKERDHEEVIKLLEKGNMIIISEEKELEKLIEDLKNSDVEGRINAAKALGKLKDPKAIDQLIQAFNDINKFVRLSALESLVEIGEPAVPALINALRDTNLYVRQYSVEVLGRIKDQRAVDPLINALKDADYPEVQYSLTKALGELGNPKAIEPLMWVVHNKFYYFVDIRGAAEALVKIGGPAISYLINVLRFNDSSLIIDNIVPVLKNIAKPENPAFPLLLKALEEAIADEDSSIYYIFDILGAKNISTDIVDLLIKKLRENPSGNLAYVLGEIDDRRAVEPLINALKDKNVDCRDSAAIALGKIGDQRAIGALIEALKDKNYQVRTDASEALAKITLDKKYPCDDFLVHKVTKALAKIGGYGNYKELKTLMIKALKRYIDKDEEEYDLGSEEDDDSISALYENIPTVINLLDDKDPKVRANAVESLGIAALENGIDISNAATKLIELLSDKNAKVREYTICALDSTSISKAIPRLIELLDDKHWKIRARAAEALGIAARQGSDISKAIPRLKELLENDNDTVREYANRAILLMKS